MIIGEDESALSAMLARSEGVDNAAFARGLELVGIGLQAAIEAIVAELRKEPAEPLAKATRTTPRKRPARKTTTSG